MGRKKAKTRRHHEEKSDPDFVARNIDEDEKTRSTEDSSDNNLLPNEHVDKRKRMSINRNKSESDKPKQHKNLDYKAKKKGCRSSSWRRAAIDTRCSPSRMTKLCKVLTTDQVEIVNSIGFGSIFHIKPPLNRKLCYELVNAVDLSMMCMFIKGEPIRISHEDIGLVFDLPIIGLKIPKSVTKEEESMLAEFVRINDVQLLGMIQQGTTDALFKRAFILYVLSGFFCPMSDLRPSPRLMGAIIDVDDVRKYNWSQFIFEWLVHQMTIYKTSQCKIRNIGGCLFFLMIVYFHRHPLGKTGSIVVRPLVANWDEFSLRMRMLQERTNIKGLFYRIHDRPMLVDSKWLTSTYKSQIVREWVVHHLELFKKLDDAVIAGKYNSSLLPKMPNYKFAEASMGTDKETEENTSGSMGGDEECDNEQMPERAEMDARVESFMKFDDAGPSITSRIRRERMKQKLYAYCAKQPRGNDDVAEEVLVNINGNFLDRRDTSTMRPRCWLLNTVVSFASMLLNDAEKTQMRSRYYLATWFMDKLAFGLDEFKAGQHKPWENLQTDVSNLVVDITDMAGCNLVSIF